MMTRRKLFGLIPLPFLARASAPPDPIVGAARELRSAMEEIARLGPIYDRVAGSEACRAFEDATWDPACDRLDLADDRFVELTRERGIPAVIVDGRLYLNTCMDLGQDLQHYPQMTASVRAADVVNLDAAR